MAHVEGPTRVALVVSFVSRPFVDNKLLPLAAGYVIPWNAMGFTFDDLKEPSTVMVPPRSTLRSLGLSGLFDKSTNDTTIKQRQAGWDYFRFCVSHMGNHEDPPQVVIMPYAKVLPLFLLGQAHPHPTYSPWQSFVLDTLQNIWGFSLALYIVALVVYLQMRQTVAHNLPSSSARKSHTSLRPLLIRLLASHGIVVMIVLVVVKHYIDQYQTIVVANEDHRNSEL